MNQDKGAETMHTSTRDAIITALAEMNYDVTDVRDDAPLGPGGLDLESLSMAELAIRIEESLGVRFDDGELERLGGMTLGDLVAEIDARIRGAVAP
jgi:acyl carrier protein